MPFSTDIDKIPDRITVTLPAGTWDEDEVVYLRPYFDGLAKQAALVAGRREVPDGTYQDGKPKVKYEHDTMAYQRHLIFHHIVDHTLRNPPTKAQAKAGKPGRKAKLTPENIAAALGDENLDYLLGLIYSMSGEPPGGYLVKGPSGRPISFRGADQTADQGGEEPDGEDERVGASEHGDDVERGAPG